MRLCSNFTLLQRSKVSLATRPDTRITFTPGGRQSFAPIKSFQSLQTFYSASVKIRRQAKTTEGKMNYRLCSIRNFKVTGAAGENLRPFSFGGSDRLLRESTQPWLVLYRRSKPVPLKQTGMAVNRLKDHTGGKKHSTKVRYM